MIKMFPNPIHLTKYRVRDGLEVFRQHLYPFTPKRVKDRLEVFRQQLYSFSPKRG